MPREDDSTLPRVAIVTGASSGIGRATAVALAADGCDVGITYHNDEDGAQNVVSEIVTLGRRAASVHLDLTHPVDAAAAIQSLVAQLGDVHVLVNNAGLNRRATVLEEDVNGWEKTLNVNLVGAWACAQAAARHMTESGQGGRIVNVTSILAFTPLTGGGAYCAAKAGLEALTKVMALELAPHDIAVNAIAPGHTATPMNYNTHELRADQIDRPVIPAQRAAAPEEIAKAIAFLASPTSAYVTGTSLLVDGGLLLASGPESLQNATGLPPNRPDSQS